MKRYRVKVTEKHVDYVWLTAPTSDIAEDRAHVYAECEYDCLYDCEVVDSEELTDEEEGQ